MVTRDRFDDKGNLGRSNIVPFKRNEPPSQRHARRLDSNLKKSQEMLRWAKNHHIEVKITNEGHHWKFTHNIRVAEWWPSSAKLVMDRDYPNGIHAHDYMQVRKYLEKAWELKNA